MTTNLYLLFNRGCAVSFVFWSIITGYFCRRLRKGAGFNRDQGLERTELRRDSSEELILLALAARRVVGSRSVCYWQLSLSIRTGERDGPTIWPP